MKLIKSIKHQAISIFVGFTVGLTCLYFALALIGAFMVEDMLIENLLSQQVNSIKTQFAKNGKIPSSSFTFVQVYDALEHMPSVVKNSIQTSPFLTEIFTSDQKHYHYTQFTLSNNKKVYLLAEVSSLLVVTNQPHLLILFITGLFFTLIVAVFLAYRFASYTTTPIINLTNSVKSKQVLNQSNKLPKLNYELGYLSESLQNAFEETAQTLAREKEFTTDVSHELRTPITVLANTLVLIEQRGLQDTDLDNLSSVSHHMQNTVTVLLALARCESLEKESCNIEAMLEQAILTVSSNTTLNVHLDCDNNTLINANSSLLSLLFINLLNNAAEHSNNQYVKISLKNKVLTFKNSVLEKHTSSTANITDATRSGVKSKNSTGIGQGLYLVTRIIDRFEWQYELQHCDQEFTLSITIS
jgi:signal transduction histidine kinase